MAFTLYQISSSIYFDRDTDLRGYVLLVAFVLIVAAIYLHIKEAFSVEVSETGVSCRRYGTTYFLPWEEVDSLESEKGGLQLASKSTKVWLNPNVFKNRMAMLQFMDSKLVALHESQNASSSE